MPDTSNNVFLTTENLAFSLPLIIVCVTYVRTVPVDCFVIFFLSLMQLVWVIAVCGSCYFTKPFNPYENGNIIQSLIISPFPSYLNTGILYICTITYWYTNSCSVVFCISNTNAIQKVYVSHYKYILFVYI
jgi:hypothetical protein